MTETRDHTSHVIRKSQSASLFHTGSHSDDDKAALKDEQRAIEASLAQSKKNLAPWPPTDAIPKGQNPTKQSSPNSSSSKPSNRAVVVVDALVLVNGRKVDAAVAVKAQTCLMSHHGTGRSHWHACGRGTIRAFREVYESHATGDRVPLIRLEYSKGGQTTSFVASSPSRAEAYGVS